VGGSIISGVRQIGYHHIGYQWLSALSVIMSINSLGDRGIGKGG